MAATQINDSISSSKPDVKASSGVSAPVSSQAAACFRMFNTCVTMAANVDAQRQSFIEDQMARFSLWTSNMAVFARSKLSLDHRLRWTPQVRDLVTSLLGLLEYDIQQLLSILVYLVSGLSVPERNQSLAGGDFERALLAISNELTLLNELSVTIRRANRKAQNKKALEQFTLSDVDGNNIEGALQEAWANNILDRFPGCDEIIRIRLASSMVSRRKQIMYRRDRYSGDPLRILQTTDKPTIQPQYPYKGQDQHQPERRETQIERFGKPRSEITSTSIRSATTLALTDFQNAQTPSVVSKSKTIALDSHEELLFPRAPGRLLEMDPNYTIRQSRNVQVGESMDRAVDETSQGDSRALHSHVVMEDDVMAPDKVNPLIHRHEEIEEVCPFCLFIISSKDIRTEKKWQEHVIGDLEAYVCLFNECDQPERTWKHSEGWLKHMRQHALQWKCPAKSHRNQSFMTQQDFQSHLVQDHKKKYTDAELALVTNRSRQESGPLFTSCPLCGQDVQQAGGKLEKHIAGHLRSLALKSLPPVYDENVEDEDDGENSGGFISNRTTVNVGVVGTGNGNGEGSSRGPQRDGTNQRDDPPRDDPHSRRDGPRHPPPNSAPSRMWECPFQKYDPHRYPNCRTLRMQRISDVITHIQRQHLAKEVRTGPGTDVRPKDITLYCPWCRDHFYGQEADAKLGGHLANCRTTNPEATIEQTGVLLPFEFDELRRDLRSGSDDVAKWNIVWRKCFPGTNLPASPYRDALIPRSQAELSFRSVFYSSIAGQLLPEDDIRSIINQALDEIYSDSSLTEAKL